MASNVFNLVSSYANWIFSNYHAIAKVNAAMPMLRLISEERDKKTGEIQFKIQISGKNIFPILALQDLNDAKIIACFSKHDQDIIRCYLDGAKKIVNRIVAMTYDRKTKEFVYTIEYFDMENKIARFKTVYNLALLLNDIQNFNEEDKLLIKLSLNNKSN
ncbi:MAG: hypothetical protein JO149_05860 [Gammaproteobacteria bacterium]|nr:hypothetical protein [Gammaproteobacteria bacterium]